MTLIDGVGDEVTHFFIALTIILILTIAWRTTSISEQPHIRTVFLLDRRLRRRFARSHRLTSRTETVTITEGTSSQVTHNSLDTVAEDGELPESRISEGNKPPEAGTSIGPSGDAPQSMEEEEQNAIVETMDADTCVLRQRRLAFYENRHETLLNDGNDISDDHTAVTETNSPNSIDTKSNESQNVEQTVMEHNYAERETVQNIYNVADASNAETPAVSDTSIRVKLKYLNDDLKLVDGRLGEQLGDFKRRHFEGELTGNKIVRLIFNGQVLQCDTETLQSCGLFDNCVVHCLVHQRRPGPGESNSSENLDENSGFRSSGMRLPRVNINNNQGRDWDLGNLLFALVSFVLGSAWYFRYEYSHLYTVTATIALVALTGIFTVVLVGMYFPDPEAPPRVEAVQTGSL